MHTRDVTIYYSGIHFKVTISTQCVYDGSVESVSEHIFNESQSIISLIFGLFTSKTEKVIISLLSPGTHIPSCDEMFDEGVTGNAIFVSKYKIPDLKPKEVLNRIKGLIDILPQMRTMALLLKE